VTDCAQAKKHIILHLIHPTLCNTAFPSIDLGALDDFTSFENWFRLHAQRAHDATYHGWEPAGFETAV